MDPTFSSTENWYLIQRTLSWHRFLDQFVKACINLVPPTSTSSTTTFNSKSVLDMQWSRAFMTPWSSSSSGTTSWRTRVLQKEVLGQMSRNKIANICASWVKASIWSSSLSLIDSLWLCEALPCSCWHKSNWALGRFRTSCQSFLM